MKINHKRRYNVEAQSLLPEVTGVTYSFESHKGKRRKPAITASQDDFVGDTSVWDSMPEAENIWTPNLNPTEQTEQETVHIVHSKRRGGKVGKFLLASKRLKVADIMILTDPA
jgi:hypothetical protein